MRLIATIAIRRHGVDDWDELEPGHSKREINLFRMTGGRTTQALKAIDNIAADPERKPMVVLTFDGLSEITALHYKASSVVMERCRTLKVDFALCSVDAAASATAIARLDGGCPPKTYANVADLVAQLTRTAGPKPTRHPRPNGTTRARGGSES